MAQCGMRGETLSVFLRRVFLEIPPKSTATGRVGKKSSFSWDFQWFRGWDSGVLLLFCFYFDCADVVFFPGKLVFCRPLSFWGGFRERTLDRDSGVVGRIALTLKRRNQSSPLLNLDFGVLFLLRHVFRTVFGHELRLLWW